LKEFILQPLKLSSATQFGLARKVGQRCSGDNAGVGSVGRRGGGAGGVGDRRLGPAGASSKLRHGFQRNGEARSGEAASV